MKHFFLIMVVIFQTLILSSCSVPVPLEDLTIALILGIDLDDENNLLISVSSPVFNEGSAKIMETHEHKANSIRSSRNFFEVLTAGEITADKIQIFLIGKEVLKHENWFSTLDTVFRNPAFSLASYVLVVDGPVSEVIFFEPENKSQLPILLKEVVKKSVKKTLTANSTIKLLHTEMYDKGMTPLLTEIKKGKNVEMVGVSMLDGDGKYKDTLKIVDTPYLLLLRDEKGEELSLSIQLEPLEGKSGIFHRNEVSLYVEHFKNKVITKYEQDQFHFTFDMSMTINIVERLLPEEILNDDELEKMIKEELKSKFESVIKKIQENKIDPIRLGPHARAFEYEHYKKVQDDWGEALANSKIDILLDINIKSTGVTK